MGSEIDLDAALAIVRRRTPGLLERVGSSIINLDVSAFTFELQAGGDGPRADNLEAIVAAVNNFEAVAERCKRAEQSVEALKAGIIDVQNEYAALERQRDEFQNRCGELWELLHDAAAFIPHDTEMVLFDQTQVALDKGAFVKGVTDGEA